MDILAVKTRLEEKIHDMSVNKVGDFYGLCKEAAGNVLLKIDPQETKRFSQIENALYDQVTNYVLPSDVKGNKIFSIRPQANRTPSDHFSQTYSDQLDLYKTNNTSSIEFNNGVKFIRIIKDLRAGPVVNEANSVTVNGTWSVGANATNLIADTINYLSGGASLKFDISASGSTAYLENSTMTSVDLSTYVNVGALFVWCYIPDTTAITSVNLRWGSSTANYYDRTVTTAVASTAFVTGWNLLRFDWSGSSVTGSPVTTAIDTLRITFNYNGTATPSCRIDNIVARIGTIYELGYYSKFLFKNLSGTWIEKPTADTDLLNLDTESFNVFLYELAFLVSQELSGEDSKYDVSFWQAKRDEVWRDYMGSYKSEVLKPRVDYYRRKMLRRR